MATNTAEGHTAGMVPAVNDIVAALALVAVYVVRVGHVAEGTAVPLPLQVATDVVVPVLAAVWLLVVPVWQVVRHVEG